MAISTSIVHTEGLVHVVTMTTSIDAVAAWTHTYDDVGTVAVAASAGLSLTLFDVVATLAGYYQFVNTVTGYCPGVKREPLDFLDVLIETNHAMLTVHCRIKGRHTPNGNARRINEFLYNKDTGLIVFEALTGLTMGIADYLAWKTLFAAAVRGCQNL